MILGKAPNDSTSSVDGVVYVIITPYIPLLKKLIIRIEIHLKDAQNYHSTITYISQTF